MLVLLSNADWLLEFTAVCFKLCHIKRQKQKPIVLV